MRYSPNLTLLSELDRGPQVFHNKNIVRKKGMGTQFQVPTNELWMRDPARQLGLNGPLVLEHTPL